MLELKNIKKVYETADEKVEALKGVSIKFRESEFVSILGQSGCGKTTLLNIIGGLDRYTSGDLIINGKSTKNFKDKDWDAYRNYKVGFVFQSYNLIGHQTVLSNVELALTIGGISKKERKERAIKALEEVEEPLVRVLIGMEREGIRIDPVALKDYGRELDREILGFVQKINEYSYPGFNPDSPKQLGELLFDRLGLPGGKKTSRGQWSTDEKTLSKLVEAHPIVAAIMEYRACSKLKSTYVDKLPQLIDGEKRVHTTYAQAFTETGRISSSEPNLQNIPIRTERGKNIRRAFVARDDMHQLISADYSQIELRLMASMSGDDAMISAFKNGEDIHRDTASRVYNIMPSFVTAEQRSKCKMVNFGIIYGISPFGLSQRLKVSRKEAADLIDTYFKLYPKIRDFMSQAIENARTTGYAETVLGRRRVLKDINSANATARQSAERDAINTPIQGSAADLIKVAMVRIDDQFRKRALRTKMVLQIHDELVFDAPSEEVEIVKEIVRNEMISALEFNVPLEVSIGIGANWIDAH